MSKLERVASPAPTGSTVKEMPRAIVPRGRQFPNQYTSVSARERWTSIAHMTVFAVAAAIAIPSANVFGRNKRSAVRSAAQKSGMTTGSGISVAFTTFNAVENESCPDQACLRTAAPESQGQGAEPSLRLQQRHPSASEPERLGPRLACRLGHPQR